MEMEDVGPRIERVELDSLERRLGVKFPEDYREFLMKYNGGYPVPDGFRFFGREVGSSVHHFLRVRGGDESESLEYAADVFAGRVPSGLFPVARDPGGNLICIGVLGGAFESQVVFWDHEGEADVGEEPVGSNLTLISMDFSSFLSGLREVEV